MTTTDDPPRSEPPAGEHDWRQAGAAWGHAATDWSCLFEHYAADVLLALFPALGVGPGCRLLDMACGAGRAVRLAHGAGAEVAGIDAADDLVAIARDRCPPADLRLGSMFELPWPDASFDAVLSVNGIWGHCGAALDEAHRVLRPGGRIGISFWGQGPPLDAALCFRVFARNAPPDHLASMRRLNDIATPGVAEAMLTAAGFTVTESGARESMIEWPDDDTAWRAVASTGPAVPALQAVGPDALRPAVLAALESCRDGRDGYRLRSDHRFVVAAKPA